MSVSTTVRSPGAIALGGVFALGTTYVILDDVRQGAEFSADHVITVLVILGTIAAGHWFWPTVRSLRLMSALGLALVFAGGTFFCVSSSAGRSAKVLQHREAEANKVSGARSDAETELKKARQARAELSASYARECSSGKGLRCTGLKEALGTADDQVRLYEVRLDGLKPAEQANGELRYTAELVALVVDAKVGEIEKALGLLTPLAKALILELATIVFFGLGFGHKRAEDEVREQLLATVLGHLPPRERFGEPAPPHETVLPLQAEPAPAPLAPELAEVIAALEGETRPVGNQKLADKLGIAKGTASQRVTELVKQGRVTRERDETNGREVRIGLVPKPGQDLDKGPRIH